MRKAAPFNIIGFKPPPGLSIASKQENGGYYLPCVLFASTGYQGSNPGVLVSRPLIKFNKALEMLSKHAEKDHYKTAVVRADEFKKTITNQQPTSIQSIGLIELWQRK